MCVCDLAPGGASVCVCDGTRVGVCAQASLTKTVFSLLVVDLI